MLLRLAHLSLALHRPLAGRLRLGRAAHRQLSLLRLPHAGDEPLPCRGALTPSGSVPRAGEGVRCGANLPRHCLHPDGGSVRHAADLLLRHVHSHRVCPVRLHVLLPSLPRDLVQISSSCC